MPSAGSAYRTDARSRRRFGVSTMLLSLGKAQATGDDASPDRCILVEANDTVGHVSPYAPSVGAVVSSHTFILVGGSMESSFLFICNHVGLPTNALGPGQVL